MLRGGGVIFGWPATSIGGGDETHGFWLGTAGDGTSKLIVAPASTETSKTWGSLGIARGTTSTTDGIANTTTLFNLGASAHPAAYHAKSLTTGGYNTWYLPAKNELNTLYSNSRAIPFALSSNVFNTTPGSSCNYTSSTEVNSNSRWTQYFDAGFQDNGAYTGTKISATRVRAVRRSLI